MVIYWSDCENDLLSGAYLFAAAPLSLNELLFLLWRHWGSTPDTPLTHLMVRPRRVYGAQP